MTKGISLACSQLPKFLNLWQRKSSSESTSTTATCLLELMRFDPVLFRETLDMANAQTDPLCGFRDRKEVLNAWAYLYSG
jgi:hypothetical protein